MPDEMDIAQAINEEHLKDAIAAHCRNRVLGVSLTHCQDCGEEIPEARRKAAVGCTRCIGCQTNFENRR